MTLISINMDMEDVVEVKTVAAILRLDLLSSTATSDSVSLKFEGILGNVFCKNSIT